MVFEFFFSATAGIFMGAAIIVIPCLIAYNLYSKTRGKRRL